jgi:hypothetical protein
MTRGAGVFLFPLARFRAPHGEQQREARNEHGHSFPRELHHEEVFPAEVRRR